MDTPGKIYCTPTVHNTCNNTSKDELRRLTNKEYEDAECIENSPEVWEMTALKVALLPEGQGSTVGPTATRWI